MIQVLKRSIVITFFLFFTNPVWSGCSPYMGLASINEIHRSFLFLNNEDDFIEVKKLDKSLSNAVMSNWNLQICETILSIFASCSPVLSLNNASVIGKYWLYSGSPEPSSYIDWIGGFDIVLSDENGDIIDYVSVNDITFQYEACNYPFPYTVSGDASTRRTYRTPDGVGDWGIPPGNSDPESPGEINDDEPPPVDAPSLGFVTDVIVGQGATAQLTMELSTSYTNDVVINFATVNGDALAGEDYVQTNGTVTIPAGQTSVSVGIDTLISGSVVDEYFFLTIENATNADVIDQVAKITILQSIAADHFSINHSGLGITCEPSTVLITAKDAAQQTLTTYTGSIQISTSTNNGDWSLIAGNGTLINGAPDSGVAQYNMVSSDQGQVTLAISNTHVETININLLDALSRSETTGSALASDDEDLTFLQAIFSFLYNDVTLTSIFPAYTSHKPMNNSLGDDAILLRAISTDINTGECVSTLNGNQTIEIASLCEEPSNCDGSAASQFIIDGNVVAENTGSVSVYSTHTLNFNNGSAILPNSLYQDAGKISLHARKLINDDLVLGSSTPISFIPAGFCLTVNDANNACPGLNDVDFANCSVFKQAGDVFSVTLSAQGWQLNGDNDFCNNNLKTLSFNESVNLSPVLVAPLGGSVGYLNTNSTVLSSGENTLNLIWSEVGVLDISMGGNTYLDSNLPINNSSTIGRFIPSAFRLTKTEDGQFNFANSGFTYTGQLTQTGEGEIGYDVQPAFSVEAVNAYATPDVIENYIGNFYKNPQGIFEIELRNLGKDGVTPLTIVADLSPPSISYQTSTDVYQMSFNVQDHFYVERSSNAEIAPFDLDVEISMISFNDTDSVSGNVLTFNPIGSEIRYGRLKIDDAFGSQEQPIQQNLYAQYFDGQQYSINTLDNDTSVNVSNVYNLIVVQEGDPSDPLLTTDSTLSGAAFNTGNLIDGTWGLQWGPTVNGRYGVLEFQYSTPSWLTYNWDESLDQSEEDPTSRVTFGRYRGHDNIIYWKELY